jgi:hypothetical protein
MLRVGPRTTKLCVYNHGDCKGQARFHNFYTFIGLRLGFKAEIKLVVHLVQWYNTFLPQITHG